MTGYALQKELNLMLSQKKAAIAEVRALNQILYLHTKTAELRKRNQSIEHNIMLKNQYWQQIRDEIENQKWLIANLKSKKAMLDGDDTHHAINTVNKNANANAMDDNKNNILMSNNINNMQEMEDELEYAFEEKEQLLSAYSLLQQKYNHLITVVKQMKTGNQYSGGVTTEVETATATKTEPEPETEAQIESETNAAAGSQNVMNIAFIHTANRIGYS